MLKEIKKAYTGTLWSFIWGSVACAAFLISLIVIILIGGSLV